VFIDLLQYNKSIKQCQSLCAALVFWGGRESIIFLNERISTKEWVSIENNNENDLEILFMVNRK
jgi:hypothetical protein